VIGSLLFICPDPNCTSYLRKFSGALQVVWRIRRCYVTLILKLEERLPSGSTQQLQNLDIVGTHVTDATTCTSVFCHVWRTSFRNLTKNSAFRGWSSKQLVASTFNSDHGPWKLEHDLQYCKSSKPLIQSSFWLKQTFPLVDIWSNKRQQYRSVSDVYCRHC